MTRRRLSLTLTMAASALAMTVAGIAGPASAAPARAAAAAPARAAAAAAIPAAAAPAGEPDLGPDVYVFTPGMPQSQIQATVDAIADQQISNQFGTQRYALLFEPGTYGSAADPLSFQVGYYTEVAGLGSAPGDVVINGTIDVYNQCFPTTDGSSNCIALDNFWRSLSNLTINIAGQTGCQSGTDFWAVSQAAPMRRVAITGGNLSLMDYCSAGPQYASGGFIADSAFSGGTVINGSQQQFLVRNTSLDGWSNGVWNQVFSGDPGAPAQSFSATSGLAGGTAPYTTLATSPVTQEEPFLQTDAAGQFSVFVPALRRDSSGPSWASGTTAGTSIPVSKFFIASPSTPVLAIDVALALGKDLILTPGVYDLAAPIVVTRPDTIVLGLGFPTLVPQHGTAAMQVLGVPGVKLSGMIFDAGPKNSPALLQVGGSRAAATGRASDPTLVQDVFFRIGGATAGSATDSLVVNSSDVILDDIWAWRADHGAGVGWTGNVADTGLVVNGSHVTAYGLAVEHYQQNEVVWNGQSGQDIFFQNEMPYDPPSQAAWMSGSSNGYPAFVISPRVTSFSGYGMGSYCFFDQGVPIESATAFAVPATPGVQLNDVFTRFLNGSGSIDHVVNTTGAAVTEANPGPSDVVSYP
ncbi:MAG TPA: glycosyl hydrolase family 28-related protein [Streptosporangiaceae bacterium]|nr:glycosyl hydrolase family 28-related protein [Streptosporangiaceae bacterium]